MGTLESHILTMDTGKDYAGVGAPDLAPVSPKVWGCLNLPKPLCLHLYEMSKTTVPPQTWWKRSDEKCYVRSGT